MLVDDWDFHFCPEFVLDCDTYVVVLSKFLFLCDVPTQPMIMLISHGRETLTTWDATPTTQEFYNWNKEIIQEAWDAPDLQSQVQYHNMRSNPRWVGERCWLNYFNKHPSNTNIHILCNMGDVEPKYVLINGAKVPLTEIDHLHEDVYAGFKNAFR